MVVACGSHFSDVLLHGQLAVQMKTQVTDDNERLVAQPFSFYQHQTSSRNSDGVTPCGALNTGGL